MLLETETRWRLITEGKPSPPLPQAKQKYLSALAELKNDLLEFLQMYPTQDDSPEENIPDAKERYLTIRQRHGYLQLTIKDFRPRLENDSKAECRELDRETREIDTQITGIKLHHADILSRFTTTIGDCLAHENERHESVSQHGSICSGKSMRQSIVEQQIQNEAARRIDDLRAQEREIQRQAEFEKQRVALQVQEEEEREKQARQRQHLACQQNGMAHGNPQAGSGPDHPRIFAQSSFALSHLILGTGVGEALLA